MWALVAVGIAWVIVRLPGLERGYPLVPLMAYTPYVAVLAVPVVLAAAALRMWPAAGAASAVAIVLAILVLPRAFGSGDGPESGGQRLGVLAANLMLGNADPDALVELVRSEEIDMLAVQELTPCALAALRRAGLDELLPERAVFPAPRSGGSGLFARYPLRGADTLESGLGGFAMARARLAVPGGREIGVVSVHPVSPTTTTQLEMWEAGLESLPPANADGDAWVLAGDFNATLDHVELRELMDSGYVDAADAAGAGLSPTWPSDDLLPPPVTIDHVLADERLAVGDASVHDLSGSDHRTVAAELFLPAVP